MKKNSRSSKVRLAHICKMRTLLALIPLAIVASSDVSSLPSAAAVQITVPDARQMTAAVNVTTWRVVWVGGQSNSVGTNTQAAGSYPTWPLNDRIQMFCGPRGSHGCKPGTFAPAMTPVYGETNVGFSLTFANLLAQTLPANEGVVIVNTGVGGTGFHDGNWVAKTGPLAIASVAAVALLNDSIGLLGGGSYALHSMLWHQGELDAGDNRATYHADYCTYLIDDLTALIDYFRGAMVGATATTPFVDGGLLPYWEDNVAGGTGGVPAAIYALNTSRACTGTADSTVFPDFFPDGKPAGDPNARSGASGMVIHFDATEAFVFGFEYWRAYLRAVALTAAAPSARTGACPGAAPQGPVPRCG